LVRCLDNNRVSAHCFKLALVNFGAGRCARSNRASFNAAYIQGYRGDDDLDEFDTGLAGDLTPSLTRLSSARQWRRLGDSPRRQRRAQLILDGIDPRQARPVGNTREAASSQPLRQPASEHGLADSGQDTKAINIAAP